MLHGLPQQSCGAGENRGDDVLQFVDGIKLGAMCARHKLLQFQGQVGRSWQLWEEGPAPKPWASSLLPTYKDGFAILIKSNDQCFYKQYLTICINKGGESNEAVGEAGQEVAFSAGCRQVGDQCKFGTCNRLYRSAVGLQDFAVGLLANLKESREVK